MAASDRTARPKAAFVYMVRCTGGQLYTGWTNDPAARLHISFEPSTASTL